jgi:glycosyltransferase involved in cell wall biosynthesis
VEGQIRFIDTNVDEVRRRLVRRARDFVWMLRGAISCFYVKPTTRTSGRRQTRAMRRLIEELKPDLIFAHSIGCVAPLWRSRMALPPVVIDFADLDHVRLVRLFETETGVIRRFHRFWALAITRRAEKLAAQRATKVLVCSEIDRGKLLALAPGARIEIVPNSAAPLGDMPPATTPTALFVGIMSYPPNKEGSQWLAAEVWPRVRSAIPNAQLVIIGEGSETLEINDPTHGIQTLGFVSDLAPYYRDARVAVCPIWRGGGTRIKIIEAAMQSRATISTSIGAEGLLFQPNTEIVIADHASKFAEACVSLLQDANRAQAIGRAAQARAVMHYSPSQIVKQTSNLCRQALTARAADH